MDTDTRPGETTNLLDEYHERIEPSAGFFDNEQCRLILHARKITSVLEDMKAGRVGRGHQTMYDDPRVIKNLEAAVEALHRVYHMLNRIDWLMTGMDDLDRFITRWDDENFTNVIRAIREDDREDISARCFAEAKPREKEEGDDRGKAM